MAQDQESIPDHIGAMDKGEVTFLVPLDLSSAFDTVGHEILSRAIEVNSWVARESTFVV